MRICDHKLDIDNTCEQCGDKFVRVTSSPLIPLDEVVRVVEALQRYEVNNLVENDKGIMFRVSDVLTAIKELGK